jgi:hypothetical protein
MDGRTKASLRLSKGLSGIDQRRASRRDVARKQRDGRKQHRRPAKGHRIQGGTRNNQRQIHQAVIRTGHCVGIILRATGRIALCRDHAALCSGLTDSGSRLRDSVQTTRAQSWPQELCQRFTNSVRTNRRPARTI